jgi:hypothetical protein
VRWTGFADLTFVDSAHLAFARAAEQAATDVHLDRPEAWVVEDRHVSFSAEIDAGLPVLEGTKRLLGALVLQAISGEAVIEVTQPYERWILRAAPPSVSKEILVGDDTTGETIRTAAS